MIMKDESAERHDADIRLEGLKKTTRKLCQS